VHSTPAAEKAFSLPQLPLDSNITISLWMAASWDFSTSTEASVTTILDSDALESSTYCKSKFKPENPGLQAAKTRVFGFGKTVKLGLESLL